MKSNILVTVTGPSCTGKTTFINSLLEKDSKLEAVVTHTTRPPRDDDSTYAHMTEEEFKEAEEAGEFAEHAYFNGYFYGTKFDSLKKVWNKDLIAIKAIEPVGVLALENHQDTFKFDMVKVWVGASRSTLEERLKATERVRDIDSELAWYKQVKWNLAIKQLTNLDRLGDDLIRLIPTFVRFKKMRVWR